MSQVTDLLHQQITLLEAEAERVTGELARHRRALDALEGTPATTPLGATVTVTTAVEPAEDLAALIKGAGGRNVEAVREFLRQTKTVTQRDVAAQLDLAPGSVSKAVRALEAMGEIRQDGKEGRSPVWTIKVPSRTKVAVAAW